MIKSETSSTFAAANALPFVSVVVPIRNEEGYILGCLESLAGQDYPRACFEVIVVDGLSTDGTHREIEQSRVSFGLPDMLLRNERRTTSAARNLGVEAARGEVIVFVDGHTRIDPTFLSAGAQALLSSGADCVGGPIRTEGRGRVGSAVALAMSSPFGVGDATFRYSRNEQWTDTVAFGAYKREVFERLGAFADVDRGEDDEFNYRLRSNGGRILLTPAIGSVYYCRDSLRGLWRQYWGYGLAKASVLSMHPERLRLRHVVPSALVLTLAGGSLLTLVERRFGWLVALTGGCYGAANLLASLRLSSSAGAKGARYLPACFATMHFAAGTGMLAGLARHLLSKGRRRDE